MEKYLSIYMLMKVGFTLRPLRVCPHSVSEWGMEAHRKMKSLLN